VKAVQAAGNVILLADATYNAASGQSPEMADTGFAPTAPGAVQRRVVYPPFAALAQAGSAVLPSLGLAAALEAGGIAPRDVRFDGNRLVMGDRVMPLSWRQVRSSD